jgi:hypothetical protein
VKRALLFSRSIVAAWALSEREVCHEPWRACQGEP